MRRPPLSPLFPYTTLFRSGFGDSGGTVAGARSDQNAFNLDGIDIDRKSTRLNSSHLGISYAVFCLKKKTTVTKTQVKTRRQQTEMLIQRPTQILAPHIKRC